MISILKSSIKRDALNLKLCLSLIHMLITSMCRALINYATITFAVE
jgi:hypothetical protein